MIRRRLSVQIWAVALCMFGGMAARATDSPEWRVNIDVQMAGVSPESALKLAPSLRDAATFDKAFAELQQMIGREEADLVGWPVAIASGKARFFEFHPSPPGAVAAADAFCENELATSESVNEGRWPTEYLPPQVPQIFGTPWPLTQHFPIPPGEVALPTAFETRNLGVTLATEAIVSKNGIMIELSIHSERGLLLGYQTTPVVKSPDGINATFYKPQISIAKNSARVTVLNGRRMLLATFVEAKPADKVLFFLLKAVAAQVSGKSPHL